MQVLYLRVMERARYAMTPTRLPGVWRLKDSPGWFVRGKALDPRTGRPKEISRVLPDGTADQARAWLVEELAKTRQGAAKPERTRFCDFALSVLEGKIARGDIWSAKGKEKWHYALKDHLFPAFGDFFVDAIDTPALFSWHDDTARRIAAGAVAASTANGHLAILKQIVPNDLPAFRTPPGRETYSEESPNALRPSDVPRFLEAILDSWPQHFAMILLGVTTGLRPSSMRPLRRRGPEADVLWSEGLLLVRRSQTRGEAVARTKTGGTRQRLPLPKEVLDVLTWHVGQLSPRQAASDLLFPSETGGFRSGSCLDKPFRAVALELELPYPITPRAMRRTNKDLSRAAEIGDTVSRAISGGHTEEMHRRYSTVSEDEKRAAMERLMKRILR